ncbi:MAG: CDP-diacylglycerol--glycerol-3-phosphate 3-phosphatidyltransferase [Mycoplasmataceae bacterium]|nr:CDP-diacylglycerol--glycerol-3-phosphate 3-phosphatidyltransferase [Mycoplasmataceae bacterium]
MRLQPKYIPNILTIFRIVLVPVIVIFMLVPFGNIVYSILNADIANESILLQSSFRVNFLVAGILFVIACITDWLDGYLARKNNWVSNFGKLWDPIADKVLINSILICLLFQPYYPGGEISQYEQYGQMIPIWIPIIMIARDVIVDATRMYASNKQIVVPANIWGKLKTVAQMLAILIIFFIFNMVDIGTAKIVYSSHQFEKSYYGIQNLMMFVALFFSILSGVIYLVKFYKMSKKSKK